MEKDIHYYAVYYLSKLAKFSDKQSETIAYASQYVDNSTESDSIHLDNGHTFDTVRTAHYNLEAFDWNIQKKIYIPFHFIPAITRESGKSFSYVTKPATGKKQEIITKLVNNAFSEEDENKRLIRIGIALHTLADTFSHFGFSGRHDDENSVSHIKIKNNGTLSSNLQGIPGMAFKVLAPQIGHSESYSLPDYPYLKWEYWSANGKVQRNNSVNTLACLKMLHNALHCAKTGMTFGKTLDVPNVFSRQTTSLKTLISTNGDTDVRCTAWNKFIGNCNIKKPKPYDKKEWRMKAFKSPLSKLDWDNLNESAFRYYSKALKPVASNAFNKTNWACFHRAAQKQRNFVLECIN